MGSERTADQAAARGHMELGGEAPVGAAAAHAPTSPKNVTPEPTEPRGAAEALRKHGFDAVGWNRGKGLNKNNWSAAADRISSNYHDTADAALAELRQWTDSRARVREQAAQAGPTSRVANGVRVEEDAQANRIRLIFEGKPDETTRTALKAAGFRWAPSVGAWQRQLSDNARAAARSILGRLTAGEPRSQYGVESPRSRKQDDNQLSLDYELDASQAGPAGEAAKREAAAVDDLHATGNVLALALSRDLAARQRVSLVGQKVENSEDLAILAQAYRDPRFETFRVIFNDADDKAVTTFDLTSG